MSNAQRSLYIATSKALTKPLLNANDLMLREAVAASPLSSAEDDHLPLLDHFPADTGAPDNALHSSHPLVLTRAIPARMRQVDK